MSLQTWNILIQRKRGKYLKLPPQHYVLGLNRIRFVLLELHPTYASTINRTYMGLLVGQYLVQRKKESFTLVSLPKSKWMILDDKQIFSNKDTLVTSWLQTLVQGSIGNGKDLKPFWNEQCQEISKRLWLPTETDCVASHSNSSSSSLNSAVPGSWFVTPRHTNLQNRNLQTTSSLLSTSTHAETWDDVAIRTQKILLYPNSEQDQVMKQWEGTARYVYNKSLHACKTDPDQKMNFQSLRNRFVTKKRNGILNPEVQEWEFSVPKDVRAECIRDLTKAYKVAHVNLKSGNIARFSMRYRKKGIYKSIVIPHSAATKDKNGFLSFYPTMFPGPIRVSKDKTWRSVTELKHDLRITYDHGKWYLVLPLDRICSGRPPDRDVCALDPGKRSFQAMFSDSEVVEFKQNDVLLHKLQSKRDLLQSLRSKKKISKSHYTRGIRRLYRRMTALIDDLHFKTIAFLTSSYRLILLPSFESQEMVSRRGRNGRGVNRDLLQLRHYTFKTRLLAACRLMKHVHTEIVTEEYTSQTCTGCGARKKTSLKTYTCCECSLIMDRDLMGARNILIKYFSTFKCFLQ